MADNAPFYSGAGPRRDKTLADAEAKSMGTPSPSPTPPAPASTPSPKPENPGIVDRIKGALGFMDGGPVDYRGGGKVKQGTTPTADDVPAMLSKGEYVLPADTVKAVGVKNLDHLRETSHNPANRAGTSHGKRGFK